MLSKELIGWATLLGTTVRGSFYASSTDGGVTQQILIDPVFHEGNYGDYDPDDNYPNRHYWGFGTPNPGSPGSSMLAMVTLDPTSVAPNDYFLPFRPEPTFNGPIYHPPEIRFDVNFSKNGTWYVWVLGKVRPNSNGACLPGLLYMVLGKTVESSLVQWDECGDYKWSSSGPVTNYESYESSPVEYAKLVVTPGNEVVSFAPASSTGLAIKSIILTTAPPGSQFTPPPPESPTIEKNLYCPPGSVQIRPIERHWNCCDECLGGKRYCGSGCACSCSNTSQPTPTPTLRPTAFPTLPDAPIATPGCASNFTVADPVLSSLNASLCAPDTEGALPPLPGPDDATVVGPVVTIKVLDEDGEEVEVTNTTVEFEVPIDEEKREEVEDKLNVQGVQRPIGDRCKVHALQCEFWDEDLKEWSSEGCQLQGLSKTGGKCLCSHLTTFMLALRESRSLEPFCAASLPYSITAALYLAVALLAILQVIRLRCSRASRLTVQHSAIGGACLARGGLLIASNALQPSPSLLVLLASGPFFAEQCIFISMVLFFAKAGLAKQLSTHEFRLSRLGKVLLFLSAIATFGPPIAMVAAGDDDKATIERLALAGAWSAASTGFLLAASLLVFGCVLARQIQVTFTKSHPNLDAGRKYPMLSLARRLKLISACWCVCFLGQAIFMAIACSTNALYDETANIALPLLFNVFGITSLLLLLLLLANAVKNVSLLKQSQAAGEGRGNSEGAALTSSAHAEATQSMQMSTL